MRFLRQHILWFRRPLESAEVALETDFPGQSGINDITDHCMGAEHPVTVLVVNAVCPGVKGARLEVEATGAGVDSAIIVASARKSVPAEIRFITGQSLRSMF